jgi:EpsI family protein
MKPSARSFTLLALMVVSAALGAALRPRISLADELAPIDLAAVVPKTFGEWHEEVNRVAQLVNPQQRNMLDKIYSQTLNRTYVNSQGYRVMLSIAYGKNQSDALQLHKPELCYPAQGFTLLEKRSTALNIPGRPISATRLTTSLGQRFEPITYWTVVGDHIVTNGIDKKLAELRYAVGNRIPDGMLVRVSSIDPDTQNALKTQARFAADLVQSLPNALASRFAGIAKG